MQEGNSQIAIYFIIICTLLVLLLSLFIITIISKYQKKQLAYKLGIKDLKLEHDNLVLDTRIQVQEHTFQQISSDIHDNIGQKLSLAKLHLNKIDFKHNHNSKDVINEVVQIITDSLNDLRDLSRSLSTDLIKSNGFIMAMENEIAQLNKIGHFVFKMRVIGDSVFLDVEKEVVLFRMAQEIIANIIKHSSARNIEVELHFSSDQLTLSFADDGKGFEINKVKDSNGILNIKRRAETLGGKAVFTSTHGQGTIVNIKIPIND